MAKAEATAEDKRLEAKVEKLIYYVFERSGKNYSIDRISAAGDVLIAAMKIELGEGRP